MSIIKWFKGLFSNKYSVVYDPARDGPHPKRKEREERRRSSGYEDDDVAMHLLLNHDSHDSSSYDSWGSDSGGGDCGGGGD